MTPKKESNEEEESKHPLCKAVGDCAYLRRYLGGIRTAIRKMEESKDTAVYKYADHELEYVQGYISRIAKNMVKYIHKEDSGDIG
jgi:predicted transcriptional regulator of viral defense system